MKASARRDAIIKELQEAHQPIPAKQLAETFGVSRQVIVGDIALLRAANHEVFATNRGYILPKALVNNNPDSYTGQIACYHDAVQAEEELRIIITHGGTVQNVMVDHPFYGVIKAALRLESHQDIDYFLQQMEEQDGEMLSSLTNGIHVHTITAPSQKVFEQIKEDLQEAGILLSED